MNNPMVFKHIEIEINTVCNTNCFGCDRMSDVAAKGVPNMTVSQARRFVDESLDMGWEWERIRLLGGEPLLHPRFTEMIGELLRYRGKFPKVFLQVLTNGIPIPKSKEYREWLGGLRISLHAETKVKGVTPLWFNNTRWVPADRDPNVGPLPPCGIYGGHGCGIGLTNAGFFLDGAGATVARVAGYDIGVMRLADVTEEAMLEQAKVLCRVCGHHNPPDATHDNGKMTTQLVTLTGETTGPFWTERLAAYNKQRPKMRVYGVD